MGSSPDDIVLVSDPEALRILRWPLRVAALVACATPLADIPHAGWFAFAGVLVLLLEPWLLPRRSTGPARCRIEPSGILLQRRLAPSKRIRAQDVRGAALHTGHRRIALMLRGRRFPIELQLPTDERFVEVARVLGLPARGIGAVEWDLRALALDRIEVVLRALALGAIALSTAGNSLLPSSSFAWFWMSSMALGLPLVAFVVHALARGLPRETLTLLRELVLVRRAGAVETFPRAKLRSVTTDGSVLVLTLDGGQTVRIPTSFSRWVPRGLDPTGLTSVTEQATNVVESRTDEALALDLGRRDEPESEWLARLDALGLTAATTVYRGGTTVDAVWRAFLDTEATPDVRAGAARVLARDPELRIRVANVLPALHDPELRVRIEATLTAEAAPEAEPEPEHDEASPLRRRHH